MQSGADALKPHVSAADADFGGHDAIAFDGSDDFLERLGVSFSTDWTIIFAALKTDLTATQMLLSAAESPAGSTDSMALAYSVTTGAPAVWWDGGAIATSTVGLRPSAATAFVASVRYADAGGSTANVTFRTGGSEEVEVASGYVPAGWDEEVFCCRRKDAANSMYWGGKIALFGRWSRALTDAECDALEAEMKAAVGL